VQTFLLWSVVSIAALAIATATFLVIAAPIDLVRDQLVQKVRDRTGRDLAVAGPTSLTFFPSMGLSLRDVSLSPPPGMTGEPMARVAEMNVRMPLWPLLRGEVQIEKLVLRRPELDLRIDAEGRRNWEFRRLADKPTGVSRGAGGGKGGSDLDRLRSLSLGDVRIEDGTIRYFDERRALREEITGIDLEIGLASLESPLEARGDFTLRQENVDVSGRLDSLGTLLAGLPSRLVVRLAGQPVEATYEGTIATAPATTLAGALTVKSGSLAGFAAWAGTPLAKGEGRGPLALSGKLETTAASIALTEADAQLGDTAVRGFAVLETRAGARPRISADLRLSALDLTRWLTPDGERPKEGSRDDAGAGPGKAAPPRSMDDLLRGTKGDQPQVRGFVARHGWSDVPFKLERLGAVDADVKLLADRVSYRKMQAGPTRITATLADRVVDATIDEMQLYEGSGRGEVHLDASGTSARLEANLRLDDVAAFELLRDASEFDWIAGRGRVSLAIKGNGRSEREIVETLDGKAEFSFHEGALIGIDVSGIIRNLQQGRIPRLERNRSDKTAFSELAASFVIKNGIAENRDLRLVSSLVRVTGSGSANLPRRTLDYTARPRLITTSSGQDNNKAQTGLELPIRITGSWDRPDVAADFDAVLKDPDQVVEAAKEIGKQFKGKKLGEALRNFLEEDDDGNATKQKARDLLRKFMKPQ